MTWDQRRISLNKKVHILHYIFSRPILRSTFGSQHHQQKVQRFPVYYLPDTHTHTHTHTLPHYHLPTLVMHFFNSGLMHPYRPEFIIYMRGHINLFYFVYKKHHNKREKTRHGVIEKICKTSSTQGVSISRIDFLKRQINVKIHTIQQKNKKSKCPLYPNAQIQYIEKGLSLSISQGDTS